MRKRRSRRDKFRPGRFTLAVALGVAGPASAETAPASRAPGVAKALQLGADATGIVSAILVADGAHVEAGQLLLEIDCGPLKEEIKLRAAEQDAAEAAYERARNGSRPDEIAIGVANVGVAQARAEEAKDAFARFAALTEGVTVTRAQILESRRDARVTAAQLEDARKRLALLEAGSRPEDIAEAAARRDAAAAALAEAKARLDRCSVRAPVAGVVETTATLGQLVTTAVPTTLARLTPDAAR